jgi:arginyl-tRNA synthetase
MFVLSSQPMFLALRSRLVAAFTEAVRTTLDAELAGVGFEYPPRPELGDLALTAAFDLARTLRRKPREIAQALLPRVSSLPGVKRADIAGGGYINLFLERGAFARQLHASLLHPAAPPALAGRVIVEHTSINPNKAAHIGHLRNAVLGDTFVRALRQRGHQVVVQNYIDDTGVQVADVVVGFRHLEKKAPAEVQALAQAPKFDHYCWDLYARVGGFYEEDLRHKVLQAETLHAIEAGDNETARLAALVAARIVDCHLATMERLGIRYDLLAHESDILRLHFWDRAFELLREAGAIRLETEGKNAGCWVLAMDRDAAGAGTDQAAEDGSRAVQAPEGTTSAPPERDSLPGGRSVHDESARGRLPLAAEGGRIDDDKVIVRSSGTVTYTGKDIAYQLWKLGLLDRDFRYRRHLTYPDGHVLWTTTAGAGEEGPPVFGHARAAYNVIDVGQSYPQRVVKAGVAALGHAEAAENSHHLAYEKVVLSPATARALGYDVSQDEAAVKVSGRKGLGVKADDLLDLLVDKAESEVEVRDPGREAGDKKQAAVAIAGGALRYFLLKYARNKIITFDMDEALAFTGDTGPYIQNSVVRARNIFAKLEAEGRKVPELVEKALSLDPEGFLAGEEGDEVWGLLVLMARTEEVVEQVERSREVSLLARHAFAVAQAFHAYYQKPRYSVLHAETEELRAFRTLVVDAFLRQMALLTGLLGIPVPERM